METENFQPRPESDVVISPWQPFTLATAYEDRPPTEYIVEKFFATFGLYVVYGAPGSMKSILLADMCAHVVSGTPWLPGYGEGVNVVQSPILWIDFDNGQRRTHDRFAAVGKANRLPADAPFYYLSMPNPYLIANQLDSMILLRDTIRLYQAKIVVIDNLGLITGDVPENGAEMAQVMGNLRAIAERSGAALILIHHQRKGGSNGSRAGDALRGHSSIEGAVDLALHIIRESDAPQVSLRSTKTRDVPPPSITAIFNYNHKAGTTDLDFAWFEGSQPKRGANEIKETIMEIVEFYGTIHKSKLVEEVRSALGEDAPGVNKVRAWVEDMIAVTGELKEEKQGTYRVIKLA